MTQKTMNRADTLWLSNFCEELSMALASDIPAIKALDLLSAHTDNQDYLRICSSLKASMGSGCSFFGAVSQCDFFPKYALTMIEIGEQTEKIPDILSILARHYKAEAAFQKDCKNILTYCLLMVWMTLAVLLALVLKVFPLFFRLSSDLGKDITGFAAIMNRFSTFLNRHLIVFLLFAILFSVIPLFLFRTKYFRKLFQKNDYWLHVEAGRFAHCMALILESGLDINRGLLFAESAAENPAMSAKIKKCRDLNTSGKPLSEALLSAGIFDSVFTPKIIIGYQSGQLATVMQNLALDIEEQLRLRTSRFLSSIEPTLVLILSVFTGLLLCSFLIPLSGFILNI